MKLIEKLAQDHRHSWIYGNVQEEMKDLDMDEAFMAGFRKAREMANDIHTNCGAGNGCCSDKILVLGEEVVAE